MGTCLLIFFFFFFLSTNYESFSYGWKGGFVFREGDDGEEEGNEDENLLWRLLDQDNKKKV